MWDFFFGDSDWVPRHHCGDWDPWMLQLYVTSNCGIFLAYLVIPFCLIHVRRFATDREILSSLYMRVSFALFIIFCGCGHLFDEVLAFVYPRYHALAVWHACTACVSWSAVLGLFWVARHSDSNLARRSGKP